MALIRVMCDSADHNRWFRGEPAAELMKHLFKKELERTGGDQAMRISVYYVLEPLEETRAVAAHYLTLKRQSFNTVSALHIEPHEASDLEITIEETTGDTDIADIDATHRNLI